jgi:ribosome-associated protein
MDGDGDLRTQRGLVVPAHALTWSFARAGGPGGQHVNKTSSKVTLIVATDAVQGRAPSLERLRAAHPDEIRVSSQESRSQWRNRQLCLERLAEIIDDAARPPSPIRGKTRPSRGAVERRLDSKKRDSDKKAGRRDPEW